MFKWAAGDRRVLVEVPLQDWTKRAAEAPVKLLAEQREVDQLQQPRLELVANLAAPWLDAELALLHVRVVVALGAFAWEAALPSDPASAKPE
jgi:uracil-DNA glycosylase